MDLSVWAPMEEQVSLMTFVSGGGDAGEESTTTQRMALTDGVGSIDADLAESSECLIRVTRGSESFDRGDRRGRAATSSVGQTMVVSEGFAWNDGGFVAPPLNRWSGYDESGTDQIAVTAAAVIDNGGDVHAVLSLRAPAYGAALLVARP